MADELRTDGAPPSPVERRRYRRVGPDRYEEEPAEWADAGKSTGEVIAQVARVAIGLVLIAALVLIAGQLHDTLSNAPQDISAVQVIQVYTEALFKAVIAIGAGIAGYVVTRVVG